MPITKIDEELKEAIMEMAPKKKDALLLRLIRKDALLVDKLRYELLQGEDDASYMKEDILEDMNRDLRNKWSHTPGLVMMQMRSVSGSITRYEKITKDKLGTLKLLIALINNYTKGYSEVLKREEHNRRKTEKFAQIHR